MTKGVSLSPQDYELQLIAYKAQVEPLASPLKKTKMDSASDNIIQEVSRHLWDRWLAPFRFNQDSIYNTDKSLVVYRDHYSGQICYIDLKYCTFSRIFQTMHLVI